MALENRPVSSAPIGFLFYVNLRYLDVPRRVTFVEEVKQALDLLLKRVWAEKGHI